MSKTVYSFVIYIRSATFLFANPVTPAEGVYHFPPAIAIPFARPISHELPVDGGKDPLVPHRVSMCQLSKE